MVTLYVFNGSGGGGGGGWGPSTFFVSTAIGLFEWKQFENLRNFAAIRTLKVIWLGAYSTLILDRLSLEYRQHSNDL